jgi:hypothetical protein
MDSKKDKFDLPYFKTLPEGFRVASMDDFHIRGRKKLGTQYLIETFHSGVFEVHTISEFTEGIKLLPFFNEGRIYIKSHETVLQN